MADLKHVGRVIATGRKCLVAYRTLPGDAYHCLIVPTENLADEQHDSIINLVSSPGGQDCYEFAEVLARARFPDGSIMLANLHANGKLIKVPTDAIEMIPNPNVRVKLSELNQIIAEQRGVSVQDLAMTDTKEVKDGQVEVQEVTKEVKDISPTQGLENLTAEERASKLRSEADRLYKEAAKLRKEAEDLAPTKKKVKEEA